MCLVSMKTSLIICRTSIERCGVDSLQHICIRHACLGCWSRQAFHEIHGAHSCGNTQLKSIRLCHELSPPRTQAHSGGTSNINGPPASRSGPPQHMLQTTRLPVAAASPMANLALHAVVSSRSGIPRRDVVNVACITSSL